MFIMETSMLKTLITLVRGRTALIAEEIADQNALLILDQQMRDATGALDRAKRALAVAIAQESQEGQRLDATHARIADLETRAVAAIEAGRTDLATEAAETIATLEAECDASVTARALFATEIAKRKGHILQQQMGFSQLERGRRIARAAEAVRVARRGRIESAPIFAGTLAEAETTLARLREHQVVADTASRGRYCRGSVRGARYRDRPDRRRREAVGRRFRSAPEAQCRRCPRPAQRTRHRR
jgi:phage shock protein A